jgi:hypothetical protein
MNWLKKAGFILSAVFCMVMLYGCKTQGEDASSKTNLDEEAYPWELGTFEGLDARTEWRIIQDYLWDYYKTDEEEPSTPIPINNLRITNYYGTYNGYVVVTMYYSYAIASPWIVSPQEFPAVWKNGQFYRFGELYRSGQLTWADLKSIAGRNAPKIENYPGKFGTFEGLDAETERQIMLDFYMYLVPYTSIDPYSSLVIGDYMTLDQFFNSWGITAYYGIYNGYIVVNIRGAGGYERVSFGFMLAGGGINQGPGFFTIAWKDGQVYHLKDLADQGRLTRDEQHSIVRLHDYFSANSSKYR